jgi:hypothetical protein
VTLRRASVAGASLAILFLVGCSEDASLPTGRSFPSERDDLRYRAEFVLTLPHFIVVEATVTDLSGSPRTLRYPDRCVVLMRAYRPGGGRVFDQFNKTCREDQPVEMTLPADGAQTFETNALIHFMLGDEPEGVYEISAYLRPVGQSEVELFIGEAELTRLPLP